MIVFVGSNPSNASTSEDAFHGSTRSSQILSEWTNGIQGDKKFVNVLGQKTENNRPLKASEIKAALPRLTQDIAGADRIVALGKTATRALTLLGASFYELPHPSGLNRVCNDPVYVAQKVKGLLEYCDSSRPDTELTKS
jgi:hypothetical protein